MLSFSSFPVYYQYYFAGLLVFVFKINADEFLHLFVDFNIHFVNELPF
jgi:hypothetical protein